MSDSKHSILEVGKFPCIIDQMEEARELHNFMGDDEPAMPDSDMVTILGKALMDLARENPDNCTPRVTQALAMFHVWEASRR
jgi:hypothetical protein